MKEERAGDGGRERKGRGGGGGAGYLRSFIIFERHSMRDCGTWRRSSEVKSNRMNKALPFVASCVAPPRTTVSRWSFSACSEMSYIRIFTVSNLIFFLPFFLFLILLLIFSVFFFVWILDENVVLVAYREYLSIQLVLTHNGPPYAHVN